MSYEQFKEAWEESGFPGANRLYAILKKDGIRTTKKEVEDFIANQRTAQLHHRPTATKARRSHIMTSSPGIIFQADLLDLTPYSHGNGGMKWLLLVIDIFTRMAAVVPMKNKTAATTVEALQRAFKDLGMKPKVLHTDQGSEFKGVVEGYLNKNDIRHRKNEVHDHKTLGIVDRFSGVVKLWIAKHQTHKQTKRYLDVLPKFVKKYNTTPHSSLGDFTPEEALKYPRDIRNIFYERVQSAMLKKKGKKQALKVGDYVRVLKVKGVFDKGYHVKYSLTVHRIVDERGHNFILDNGRYYRAARLLKVPPPREEEEAAPVDVAQQARRTHRVDVKLKTEGIRGENVRRSNRERKPTDQVVDEEFGRVIW